MVTGATGALGAGVVQALLARGAVVHAPMMEATPPSHFRHERVVAAPGVSVDDEAQVSAFYRGLPALWASIHLVGGFGMAPIAEQTARDLDKQWRINALTCFLACREAVIAIRRTNAGGGRIVNVGARPVVQPVGGMTAYAAAKAAVASITQSLAAELRDEKILVNAVLPSIIDSPANRTSMPTADFAAWPKPDELAEAIAFLASPANALTSGALVPVYGRA